MFLLFEPPSLRSFVTAALANGYRTESGPTEATESWPGLHGGALSPGESADSPQAATAPPLCLLRIRKRGAARKPLAKIRGVYKQESGVSLA